MNKASVSESIDAAEEIVAKANVIQLVRNEDNTFQISASLPVNDSVFGVKIYKAKVNFIILDPKREDNACFIVYKE